MIVKYKMDKDSEYFRVCPTCKREFMAQHKNRDYCYGYDLEGDNDLTEQEKKHLFNVCKRIAFRNKQANKNKKDKTAFEETKSVERALNRLLGNNKSVELNTKEVINLPHSEGRYDSMTTFEDGVLYSYGSMRVFIISNSKCKLFKQK